MSAENHRRCNCANTRPCGCAPDCRAEVCLDCGKIIPWCGRADNDRIADFDKQPVFGCWIQAKNQHLILRNASGIWDLGPIFTFIRAAAERDILRKDNGRIGANNALLRGELAALKIKSQVRIDGWELSTKMVQLEQDNAGLIHNLAVMQERLDKQGEIITTYQQMFMSPTGAK